MLINQLYIMELCFIVMEKHGICDSVGVILLFVCLPNISWMTHVACCYHDGKGMS